MTQPALFEDEADQQPTQQKQKGPGKTPDELVVLRQCMKAIGGLERKKQSAVVQFLVTAMGEDRW